jgi:hypothetical protein
MEGFIDVGDILLALALLPGDRKVFVTLGDASGFQF